MMIHVECYPDEALVKMLGFTRKQIIHCPGKYRLCNYLEKIKNAVGIIEFDKGETDPSYLKKFELMDTKHGVAVFREKKSSNKIIVLHNDLEDWIIHNCKLSGISIENFGLPGTRNQLHREINSKLTQFKKLVGQLIQEKNLGLLFLQQNLH